MVQTLENIDKSKVYVDRIEGLDEVVSDVIGDTLTGAVSTITTSDLTANKILISDNNGKVAASNKTISDIGGDSDNLSITKNASNKLQAVGVINQNATTTAIKTWTGTLAEYNAIIIKDNNTLYNITDDMQASTYEAYSKNETNTLLINSISTLLTSLYPVGSIYIGVQSYCPLASLISGSTWQLVSQGRALWGSDENHAAGTGISAGLPNITGTFNTGDRRTHIVGTSGAIYRNTVEDGEWASQSGAYGNNQGVGFNASLSNSIYGNSTTVQPPAYVVNIWQRTA